MISQQDAMADLVKAEAEIERLQAELVEWQAKAGRFAPGIEAAESLLEDANKKIERLTLALEAVDSEILLTGQLKELVDEALHIDGQLTEKGE